MGQGLGDGVHPVPEHPTHFLSPASLLYLLTSDICSLCTALFTILQLWVGERMPLATSTDHGHNLQTVQLLIKKNQVSVPARVTSGWQTLPHIKVGESSEGWRPPLGPHGLA